MAFVRKERKSEIPVEKDIYHSIVHFTHPYLIIALSLLQVLWLSHGCKDGYVQGSCCQDYDFFFSFFRYQRDNRKISLKVQCGFLQCRSIKLHQRRLGQKTCRGEKRHALLPVPSRAESLRVEVMKTVVLHQCLAALPHLWYESRLKVTLNRFFIESWILV